MHEAEVKSWHCLAAGRDKGAFIMFKTGNKVISLNKTQIMGVLNCTPDSFSDGGKYVSADAAVHRGKEMIAQGADIIDVGGQSTRPGYKEVTAEEEWNRISGVIAALLREEKAVISVDTYYPQVALKALQAGVHIINDISGFKDEMLEAVSKSDCGCIVMYSGGAVTGDILADTREFFVGRKKAAQSYGIADCRLCFDPGIGFNKKYEENLKLIANVEKTKLPGHGYLMALSRKRVIGEAGGNPPPEKRTAGTIAANTIAVMGGANILRVHDVFEAVQAAKVADAVLKIGED